MPLTDIFALPFLTRKMLSFEHGAVWALRVRSISQRTATLFVRGFTREGSFGFRHSTASDGSTQTTTHRLPDIPIFLSILGTDVASVHGQVYVSVDLLLNNDQVFAFGSGYVNATKSWSWPATNASDYLPGRGLFRVVTSADPAANAQISLGSTSGRLWRIHHMRVQLITDVNAANRRVHVTIDDANVHVIDFFSSVDQVASQTINYSVAAYPTALDEADDNDILIPIPGELWLPPTGQILTTVTNMQVTDNFGAMTVLIEEFPFTGA